MKLNIRTICRLSMTLLLLGSTVTSCKKYLERTEESVIDEEIAFRNFINFQGFTEELYMCIPNKALNGFVISLNWGDDEIVSTSNPGDQSTNFHQGNFWRWQSERGGSWMDKSANTSSDMHTKALWPLAWYGIRKANLGLDNMHRLTDATEEERQLIEGQLLFFRAWFHFNLIEHFGGLPYIDRVLPADEALREPRLSYHECAEKIATDLRRAADLLPINWDNTVAGSATVGKNHLRINKIMALAYLGKNLLWAASPLMNRESTGAPTYNQEYCQRAATVFGELLTLVENGQTQYALQPWNTYKTMFVTTGQNWALPGGTEAIFRAPYVSASNTSWDGLRQYLPQIINGRQGGIYVPTANYVKQYSMANGLPLPDDLSQADAESGYDPNFPWANRDPRFYRHFYYDGVMIVQTSAAHDLKYCSLHTGGTFREERNASRTGFLLRKFITDNFNNIDGGWARAYSTHWHIPYLRLSDVYLMYAEAALMGYNSIAGQSNNFSKTAEQAVNTIRERAGMVPVHSKFTTSVDSFLDELRRERAVELSYEGHRLTDLRRWLLLTDSRYANLTALEFDRTGDFSTTDPENNQVVNLRERVIMARRYDQKHYWLPLKVSDVTQYPEFYQNPGW